MRTIVVIASGPSLTSADVEYCSNRAEVIVVNDGYRIAPWADWCYAADFRWWALHHEHVKARRWTCDASAAEAFGLYYIEGRDEPGLCRHARAVHLGENSGYQAIGLAYHLGADRIVLLGFDMGATGNGHWFGDHPPEIAGLDTMKTLAWPRWREHFAKLAADLESEGIDVVNATRETALTCFRRASLSAALSA